MLEQKVIKETLELICSNQKEFIDYTMLNLFHEDK